ncbi:hypothetical protein [Umezawaea sp.]|uniref:hypothetical protein n=1 Tax=Umezawaea sp. TaxID=1955258 RepID=UPI002ED425DF
MRLVFEHGGREVRVWSREAVEVLVPPTDQLDGHLGVWAEGATEPARFPLGGGS